MIFPTALVLAGVAAAAAAESSESCKRSPGCGARLPKNLVPGGPSQNISINSYGVNRTYLLHLPSKFDNKKPAPLYFSFSGANRNASEQEGLSQFSNPFFNPSGIAVYPEGVDDHWLSNPSVSDAFPNDIDFVLDLIDHLEGSLCIDSSKIYAAGKSNGGGLVNLLACNATSSARFAAFASVSGAYYKDKEAKECNPGKVPTPFLEFHGLNDTTVPYDGKNGTDDNHSEYPVLPFVQAWAVRNGCSKDQKPDVKSGLFGGLVKRYSYSCGKYKDVVQHYQENDLGHIWPSTVPNDDCVEIPAQCPDGHYTFNATKVIFDFFGRYQLHK